MNLTKRFDEALSYASMVHAGQVRKGTTIPYMSHLLGVASIVLEYDGTEDEAVGALLHDAVEDGGGRPRLEDIARRFGENVALIVLGCTDADTLPKPPWRERKEKYIEHLRHADDSIVLVSTADKLYNAKAILRDYKQIGESLWERFNAKRDQQLWYYRTLTETLKQRSTPRTAALVDELDGVVTELEHLARATK